MARRSGPREIAAGILLAILVSSLVYLLVIGLARYTAVVFCAVLLAVALDGLARLLNLGNRLPPQLALTAVVLLLLALGSGAVAWTGPRLVEQFEKLSEEVPKGFAQAEAWLGKTALGAQIEEHAPSPQEMAGEPRAVFGRAKKIVSTSLATATDALIIVVLGLFFAASPQRYASGAVRLERIS